MNRDIKDERYRLVNGRKLRYGYTTGSCAAAAAAASLRMLLTGDVVSHVRVRLPGGDTAMFEIRNPCLTSNKAICSIVKDGGDDPDVTHGLSITAEVSKFDDGGILIEGGEGVGRITQEGLRCKVGDPAINPVPRKMIRENLIAISEKNGYFGGIKVRISVPGGEKIAKNTFNPRLGIVGGISILGTTGIVEPMSEKALVDTIKMDIDRRYAENCDRILIVPGNYGKDFCKNTLGIDIDRAAIISNYVGEALDYIRYKGFREVFLVGHTGKLIKIAAGVMNTHSMYADARMEVFAAHVGALGASSEMIEEILHCNTTDQAFETVSEMPWQDELKKRICNKAMEHLNFRLHNEVEIQLTMFTTNGMNTIKSPGADGMAEAFREESKVGIPR